MKASGCQPKGIGFFPLDSSSFVINPCGRLQALREAAEKVFSGDKEEYIVGVVFGEKK